MKLFGWFKTKFVVWVWNHTPTCAEMSRLTSRALEHPLTFKARAKMRLHFVICAWPGNVCRSETANHAADQGWALNFRCKVCSRPATNPRVSLSFAWR
jgi:hypothetical protein